MEIRWNSFYDKIGELLRKPGILIPEGKNELQKSESLLAPIIEILNYAQRNDSTWEDFVMTFMRLKDHNFQKRVKTG